MSFLSPESRTALIEAYAFHAPLIMKRVSSALIGLPLRREIRGSNVRFIHIPKNAGTTISTQLYGRHIGHRSAQFYKKSDPNFFETTPRFALYRDPVARFISAYGFACKGGSENVPASVKATKFARSFESATDCAKFIATLGPKNRDRLDPVFRSQSHYVCDQNGNSLVHKLIDLQKVSGTQLRIAGRTIDMAQRENRIHIAKVTQTEADPDLISIVQEAYVEDFKLREHVI